MNLSWMFGSSLEQHHLLWAYLAVWFIQGGYCAWVAGQWLRAKRAASTPPSDDSPENG